MKAWYGKKVNKSSLNGETVYTRFYSMTEDQFADLVEKKIGYDVRKVIEDHMTKVYLNKPIEIHRKYAFLNLTQAEYLFGDRRFNTAVYLTDSKN